MSSTSKIAKILVQSVNGRTAALEQKVACESFWSRSPCVIVFFRRFG